MLKMPGRGFIPVIIIALTLVCLSAWAAETRYVTDILHVTVRSGPSVENKIIHRLLTGDKLLLLGPENDGWVKVRLADGKEGWMISRYLQDEPPAMVKLRELDPQNKSLLTRLEQLTMQNRDLSEKMEAAVSKAEKLEKEYGALKNEAAGFLKLKQAHQKLKSDYEAKSALAEDLTTEVDSLRFSGNLKWFLAGAGVLVVGWLMGLALGRRKRRWSSSLH